MNSVPPLDLVPRRPLRAEAEERLADAPAGAAPFRSAEELLHELQVHQVELEMQNESLRETRAALEESRDRYVDLYEFAPVGYIALAPDGRISAINLTGSTLLRAERLSLLQQRFETFVVPEDREHWHRHFLELAADDGRGAVELALTRGDGTVFQARLDYVRENVGAGNSGRRGTAGGRPGCRITLSDVSERKAIEQEQLRLKKVLEQEVAVRAADLAQTAENMRLFVKHAPIAIAMLDRDMAYLATSDRWLAEYGGAHAELVGLKHDDVHAGLPEAWRRVHRQCLAGATFKNDEDEWLQADGSRRWLRWAMLPWTLADGEIGGVIISAEDITARKQAEAALRESEARFRAMADAAPVLIWLSGTDKSCSWFNNGWLAFTGRSLEQELNNGWAEGVHADDRQRCLSLYDEAFDRRAVFEMEYRLRGADGEYRWVIDRGVPRYGAGGEFLGYIGSCTDITLRKTSEQQLHDAMAAAELASRAKSIFLANMSHEIRTPLNVIIGLGHLLNRDIVDPVQRRRLDQLCATSDHLLALINDVLDLSKIEAGRLTLDDADFRLGTVIDRVLEVLARPARDKQLTLTTDVAPRLRDVVLHGDSLRLAQILINLGTNAVKFTDCGSVRLEIACRAEDAEGMALSFAVADTGIGIAPADQARLFQVFSQLDSSPTRMHGGSGLGLAISQRLAELMGGRISVASVPAAGSRFSFELKLPRVAVAPIAMACTPASLCGLRVLFAEDHPLSQEILFEMLEDLGCEVEAASDGAEAVACAEARGYDLIIMDMQMPRMDGLEAARAIRALPRHRATPIVALTANAFAEDRQRCLDAGMNGHVGKPVTPATLAAALGQWLPDLAIPRDETPLCDNELSRALAGIPGLDVSHVWRRSPEQLLEYCRQLDRFLHMHEQDMARLRERLAASEYDAAHVLAHNLKGIAGLIGARRVASLTTEIVQGLRAQAEQSVIRYLAEECEQELTRLAAAVRALPPTAAANATEHSAV